jgi:hypothetical protein
MPPPAPTPGYAPFTPIQAAYAPPSPYPPPPNQPYRPLPVIQQPLANPYNPPPPPIKVQQFGYIPITPQPHPNQISDPFAGIIGQYPGESVGERLGKNVVLRMMEAMFTEIARFFHYWTWPNR